MAWTDTGVSLAGTPGADGADGADGDDGSPGADGSTVLNGSGTPSGGTGADGDFYIDTTPGAIKIFGPKTSGTWGSGTSLVGTAGSTGSTGTAGTNGKSVLNGTAAPTTEGVDGDFYLRTSNSTLYGPKASGAWPGSPVSLVGPTGSTGSTGSNGTNGKTVLSGSGAPSGGADGDFWIDTTAKVIYGPKASGTWPGSGTSMVGLVVSTYSLAYASSVTPNYNNGNHQYVTLTGDMAIVAPTNVPSGSSLQLTLYASGGARTVTLDAGIARVAGINAAIVIESGKIVRLAIENNPLAAAGSAGPIATAKVGN
jgi:hypothetical protein